MRWMYFAFLLAVVSCNVPIASPEKNTTIVIATDQVTPADSAFFAQFERKKGVNIELRQLSANEILDQFEKSKYNTGIDLVIVHRLYDLRRLKQAGIFQKIRKENLPKSTSDVGSRSFFGIGLDPFICVSRNHNTALNVYDDLMSIRYINLLSDESKAHLYTPFEDRMSQGRAFERIKEITESEVPKTRRVGDSIAAILTTKSDYYTLKEDTTWKGFTEIHLPNNRTSGVFHDVLTLGIVKQSSHHDLCLELLDWILQPANNKRFNDNRHYDSFIETDNYKRYTGSPESLLQYHTMVERILEKLQ